jgi:hypothetical protein
LASSRRTTRPAPTVADPDQPVRLCDGCGRPCPDSTTGRWCTRSCYLRGAPETMKKARQPIAAEERTVPCPHCDRKVRHSGDLVHHIAVNHPERSTNPDHARRAAGTGF